MNIIDPEYPVYNAIIFYIMFICIILIIRPKIMYCCETKKFKSFGFGDNKTLMSFPIVAISMGIILYMFFLWVEILYLYLNDK